MSDDDPQSPRLIHMLWGRLMRDGHFHAAAFAGLLAHFQSRETGDKVLEESASTLIETAMNEVAEAARGSAERQEPACSFCAKKQPEVRLVEGPGVFICEKCARVVGDVFKDMPIASRE